MVYSGTIVTFNFMDNFLVWCIFVTKTKNTSNQKIPVNRRERERGMEGIPEKIRVALKKYGTE